MTLTLDMAPEMEIQLREEAAREGLEPERYVLGAVQERLGRAGQANNSPTHWPDLEAGYRAMAADEEREAEAQEWAEIGYRAGHVRPPSPQ